MDHNLPYLAAAYGAWWLVITLYAGHLARQLRQVRQELDALKAQVETEGAPRHAAV